MEKLLPYLYIAPAFVVTIVFSFVSMGISLWASFYHYDAFAGAAAFAGLDNYRRALFADDSYFWLSLRNTAFYVAMSVVGVVITALPLALLCQRAERFQALFRTLYFLLSITPGVVLALVFYHLFGVWGQLLDNACGRRSLRSRSGHLVSQLQYGHLLGRADRNTETFLYEAAEIDGANRWQQFRHVTIPLLRNTLVFVSVMTIIGLFQVFTSVYIMTQGGPERSTEAIAYTIFVNAFAIAGQMGYASALAWLLFAVVFVFVFIQMRVFFSRGGSTMSSAPGRRGTHWALVAMIRGAIVMVYPYAFMIGSSLKTRKEFAEARSSLIPPRYQPAEVLAHLRGEDSARDWLGADWPVYQNYVDAIRYGQVDRYLANSFIYAVLITAAQLFNVPGRLCLCPHALCRPGPALLRSIDDDGAAGRCWCPTLWSCAIWD